MTADARSRLRAALARSTRVLSDAGIVSASAESRALLARAARTEQPLVLVDVLPESFEADLEALLERRASREPLQLVLGEAPFRRLAVRTREGVFIPRPETELAVDLVLDDLRGRGLVAPAIWDLCTGTGAIAAALVDECPRARVTAVEIEPAAVRLARENVAAAAHAGAPGSWTVVEADAADPDALAALEGARGGLDALVSNPPYIPARAIPRDPEVADWDPARALYGGGEDGLEVPRAVIAAAAVHLGPGGILVMEHADVQGEQARALAEETGAFAQVRTAQDLTGRDRFLVARRTEQIVGD